MLKPRPKAKNLRSLLHSSSSSSSHDEQQQQDAGEEGAAGAAAAEAECPAPNATATTTSSNSSGTTGRKNETSTSTDDLVPFWKPTLALHLVHHFEGWPRAGQLPPFIVEQVLAARGKTAMPWGSIMGVCMTIPSNHPSMHRFRHSRPIHPRARPCTHARTQMEIDPDTGFLWPIVYPSEFWLLKEHLVSLDNASLSHVPLAMSYAPIGFFKWQIQVGWCWCCGMRGVAVFVCSFFFFFWGGGESTSGT